MDQVPDPTVEELAEGGDVTGLSGNDATGRVFLVEAHAQALRVGKNTQPQLVHDVLADRDRPFRINRQQQRCPKTGDQKPRHNQPERGEVTRLRCRETPIDACSNQGWACHLHSHTEDDHNHGGDEPPAMRFHDVEQQRK